jgi:glucose-1-phosphate adenylyltransferase
VRGSVLSPGVIVEKDAVVEDCVLMHDTIVREGARLRRVVCDKDVVFGRGSSVGFTKAWSVTGGGEAPSPLSPLTIVGKRSHIGDGAVVPAGREIAQTSFERTLAPQKPFSEGALL